VRRALASCLLIAVTLLPQAGAADAAFPDEDTVPAAGLRCTERVAIPTIENVIDAKWAPDGMTLAINRLQRNPSASSPAGYHEDEVLETLDMRTRTAKTHGIIEYGRPAWSASGRYLAYWGHKADFLEIAERGEVIARLTPSMPEFRWAGDTLVYIERSTIRIWNGGKTPGTITKLIDRYVPHYPADDWNWSGDGTRSILTRYDEKKQEPERFVVQTFTGDGAPLELPGATYTEWAATGSLLLVRYRARLELRDFVSNSVASIPIARSAVHSWGPDGSTVFVRASRASLAAGDAFEEFKAVWPPSRAGATAITPDLFGSRGFSANSKYFAGTVRTERHASRLEVFRCYEITRGDPKAAPTSDVAARAAAMDAGTGRLIRPVAGGIAQFLHVGHSGVDVAAPFGSPIVAGDAGTVTKVAWHSQGEGGLYLCVQHAAGLETCYYHVSTFLVGLGERVVRGQPIALVGMSGRTMGPHVHWEAKLFGRIIDPLLR
jgi:murein DD-endopeptidase MepM/ murein hydrolase activator NlpD